MLRSLIWEVRKITQFHLSDEAKASEVGTQTTEFDLKLAE